METLAELYKICCNRFVNAHNIPRRDHSGSEPSFILTKAPKLNQGGWHSLGYGAFQDSYIGKRFLLCCQQYNRDIQLLRVKGTDLTFAPYFCFKRIE